MFRTPSSMFSNNNSSNNSPVPPNPQDTVFWEHWMCLLATNLTPQQWQAYWQNYAAMFGLNSLPFHLFSFFNNGEYGQGQNGMNTGERNDLGSPVMENGRNDNEQKVIRTESEQMTDHERCEFDFSFGFFKGDGFESMNLMITLKDCFFNVIQVFMIRKDFVFQRSIFILRHTEVSLRRRIYYLFCQKSLQ